MGEQAVDLGVERCQFRQIHHADGSAANLVLVGGADAAHRGADFRSGGGGILAQSVKLAVDRENQRRVFSHPQIVAIDRHALGAQGCDLFHQMVRIDDDAVADHGQLARPHDARGQQRELVGHAVDDKRMAGVVPALKAHDDVGLD